jgi:hypothetical protein
VTLVLKVVTQNDWDFMDVILLYVQTQGVEILLSIFNAANGRSWEGNFLHPSVC